MRAQFRARWLRLHSGAPRCRDVSRFAPTGGDYSVGTYAKVTLVCIPVRTQVDLPLRPLRTMNFFRISLVSGFCLPVRRRLH
jgi:hypothetical protein